MRPIDIYNKTIKTTEKENSVFNMEEHFPEINFYELGSSSFVEENSSKLTIYSNFFHSFDYRRYICIYSAWFDGKPFMIMQNAGREGRDHENRFITDIKTYHECMKYLQSFYAENFPYEIYSENEDLPELTNFYGYTIEEKDLE